MTFLKRPIRIPAGKNRHITLPLFLIPILLCLLPCGCLVTYGTIDTTLRSVGILPTRTSTSTNTPTPTNTFTPTTTPTPTPTPTNTPPPTSTRRPTWTPHPTYTPRTTSVPPTATHIPPTSPPATIAPAVASTIPPTPPPTIPPTIAPTEPPPPAAVCDCSGDLYNCTNFTTHAQAQACYNYCISLGRGDIHKLDRDNDGIACESLP
ncbi:MAG: excalibur calcium-binding domain-containing protein [Chloroflexota bacterium]|nr:excalibur calcium-binding domain-containing protein [Chloroflexota bacterium]